MTAASLFFGSPLYRLSLFGRAPSGLAHRLPARWPGDAERGRAILAGEVSLAGQTIRNPAPLWSPPGATEAFLAELHGFSFLPDLLAAGGSGASRLFVRRWIEDCGFWHRCGWGAAVTGRRLSAWLGAMDDLGADPELLASIGRQARHLARAVAFEPLGIERLAAYKGLLLAAISLGWSEARQHRLFAAFERELPRQFNADGGHIERSSVAQLIALRDLVDLRTAFHSAELPPPQGLAEAIEAAASMLRLFRHGDGRFAHFNGEAGTDAAQIDLLLSRSGARGRTPASAPQTGFERLTGGKTVVLVDTGAAGAHAGTFSFEMSHGKEPLVVNCGGYEGPSPDWRTAVQRTAAHSTLVVEDRSSAETGMRVSCGREQNDEGQWIEASHDGYAARFGLIHTRRLFLSAAGDELRGEDRLFGRAPAAFAVRFHLHPTVQVSLTQDGTAALLRLPSGVGWRLRSEGASLSLGESVHIDGDIRKTDQLVLAGRTGSGGACILWSIRREGRRPADG